MDKQAYALILTIGLVLLSPALLLVSFVTNSFDVLQVIFIVFAVVLPCVGVLVTGWGVWGLAREKF